MILMDANAEQSQSSILVAFTEGERPTNLTYGIPHGCGGVAPIDLPRNKIYKHLYNIIKKLPQGYQNILMRKFTTNVKNVEIAKENHTTEDAIKSRIYEIYNHLKSQLAH